MSIVLNDTEKAIGECWDKQTVNNSSKQKYWWHNSYVIRHINKLVYNIDSPVFSSGLHKLLLSRLGGRQLTMGISIGCGSAIKELDILEMGIIDRFILFELSEERIKLGLLNAEKRNLQNRIKYLHGNAFNFDFSNHKIDFVHWNNSLHHMLDVDVAVKWSYDILTPDGIFYMDDYVGPNRFQYPKYVLDLVNNIRDNLPKKYLQDQRNNQKPRGHITNVDPEELMKNDPSEAADSGRILSSVSRYFKNADIKPTGGIVYFIALHGLWENFNEKNDDDIFFLSQLLELDKHCTTKENFMSPYAVALATK